MEIIDQENIMLQSVGNELYTPFKLYKGSAVFFFSPYPQSGNSRFVENQKTFQYLVLPKCVSIPCEIKSRKDLHLINEHLSFVDDIKSLDYDCIKKHNITKHDLDEIETGGIRILNTLLHRLNGDSFLEINILGLSFESIESLLTFILKDLLSKKDVTYIVVAYTHKIFLKHNPIEITTETFGMIMDELYRENEWMFQHFGGKESK
ncbi:MAG: hypothetical protein KIH03_13600 [Paludibacteraceae bacterium]|nr:hypothetical protein [Paludibacteraceae bacterium]